MRRADVGDVSAWLKRQIAKRWLLDLGADPLKSILLSSSPRSGSTWVAELINHRNGYRYLFEPMHQARVPAFRSFGDGKYLRPTDEYPEHGRPIRAVMTGKVRGRWIDQFNRRLVSRSRLIKVIRANLLLGWIARQFPRTKIVLLIRHPCAVALSIQRQGWTPRLDWFLRQPELVEDHLRPFQDELAHVTDPFQKLVASWCIEHWVAIHQLHRRDAHCLFYEHLCREPEAEVRRLFAYLQQPFDPRVLRVVRRPSAVTHRLSALRQGGDVVADWRRRIDDTQLDAALRMLRLFRLDRLYSAEPMPRVDADQVLRPSEEP
jgi:hypothetical protein